MPLGAEHYKRLIDPTPSHGPDPSTRRVVAALARWGAQAYRLLMDRYELLERQSAPPGDGRAPGRGRLDQPAGRACAARCVGQPTGRRPAQPRPHDRFKTTVTGRRWRHEADARVRVGDVCPASNCETPVLTASGDRANPTSAPLPWSTFRPPSATDRRKRVGYWAKGEARMSSQKLGRL
jgi:hypothetical protein